MSYISRGVGQGIVSPAGGVPAWVYDGSVYSNVAPPAVPTPEQLASDDASGVVQSLVDDQMRRQQALNAAGVQETFGSEVGGGLYQAGETVSAGLSKAAWIAGGVLLAAVVILLKVR